MQAPKVGDVFKHDFIFTDDQILTYAMLSGDSNPIHVTAQYAAQTDFGRCIVHGYFSISVFSKIYGTLLYPDGHILISQSAKYIKPLFTGTDYVAVITAKALLPTKNRVMYQNDIIDRYTGELKITGEAVLMNKQYYNW
ncbi:MaoC/PaaZ C-terminal domain-containing protein [Pedobacter sp. KR3-3]|uniref:MaoC/PaaZ C-terminal domain-containing protein n=1 Tax=Pedobacter albus TaxID=3113905 RepID=A0ABU7I3K1_9SPHI|nr:MaoC/PaaZ C-terminal domain-containing protein [Pedobacter sp. KR3-3]MEE1944039.1 MaoC/PaaZ C-terminal domain-containing protein [Pedobacter sp. KR3-3]